MWAEQEEAVPQQAEVHLPPACLLAEDANADTPKASFLRVLA